VDGCARVRRLSGARHAAFMLRRTEQGLIVAVPGTKVDVLMPRSTVTSPIRYVASSRAATTTAWAMREGEPIVPPRPRLLDRVRAALRVRHYSRGTSTPSP
jgi:hypothetical protein